MAGRWIARLGYGLFKEKRWRVATVEAEASAGSVVAAIQDRTAWSEVATPRGYRFLADPFFDPDGRLVVEALHSGSARGRLMLMEGGEARVISGRDRFQEFRLLFRPRAAGSPSPRCQTGRRHSPIRSPTQRWASPLNSTSPAVRGFSIRPPSCATGRFIGSGTSCGRRGKRRSSAMVRRRASGRLRQGAPVEPDPDVAAGRADGLAISHSTAGDTRRAGFRGAYGEGCAFSMCGRIDRRAMPKSPRAHSG